MTLDERLIYAFTLRETAMFGFGMGLTGLLTFETVNGSSAAAVGLLTVALSAIAYWVEAREE